MGALRPAHRRNPLRPAGKSCRGLGLSVATEACASPYPRAQEERDQGRTTTFTVLLKAASKPSLFCYGKPTSERRDFLSAGGGRSLCDSFVHASELAIPSWQAGDFYPP